jgi:MoaA/NifB/PqqE/SkfB family radical SAM enzyme
MANASEQKAEPSRIGSAPGALMQVLRQCNYACSHCSQSAPLLSREARAALDSSLPVLLERIDTLFETGHRRVRFTGGEPFLHPHLRELVLHAAGKGMEVSFVTNASRIGEEERRWLAAAGPLEFWVSFYGYPAAVHDQVCGRPGGFERTRAAVERLLADGHRVGAHYPLERSTLEGCPDFVALLGALGARAVKVMQLFDQGRAHAGYETEDPRLSDLESVLPRLRDAGLRHPATEVRISLRSGQRELFESFGFRVPAEVGCHASLDGYWTIDLDGFVYPCCLFLNTGEMRLAHLEDAGLREAAARVDHRAFAAAAGLGEGESFARCPALAEGAAAGVEFICPLKYARLEAHAPA